MLLLTRCYGELFRKIVFVAELPWSFSNLAGLQENQVKLANIPTDHNVIKIF